MALRDFVGSMREQLHLQFLGKFEIHRDGQPVTGFRSGKAQALLCYLAMTGKSHTRPVLAGLLWSDMPEANARRNLSQTLSNLRRLVGPHLTITRQTIAFNRDSSYRLDVEAFQNKAQPADPASTIDRLQQAAALYQGDFLDGFYVRNAPLFEEWVLGQRTRLRELAMQTLHHLSLHYTDQGEPGRAKAIDYTTRLLVLEPWWEEAHRQLMLLLALGGQRSAALAHFETCRQVLADELGVEPAEETTALYQRIRQGELGQDRKELSIMEAGEQSSPLSPHTLAPQHNLPPQLTPFIGRETELAALDDLIAKPEVRLVTIVGPGGMGKTRLALALAERLVERPPSNSLQRGEGKNPSSPLGGTEGGRFPNGVHFIPLVPLSEVSHIAPAMAEALDFPLETGGQQRRTPQQQILDYLRQKQMFIVLDNFDHLLDGVDFVADILKVAPAVQIIATSRERLHLHQEQIFAIQGLQFPKTIPTELLEIRENAAEYAAVKLFIQSAQRVRHDFQLQVEDLLYLTRICHLVEGMPLGVELAAGWVDMLSLANIAAEIQKRLDFLETDVRNVPDRHRSIRAVFDASWQQMNEVEREVFPQLSVFRGGFTRQAAQEVTGASLRLLGTLASTAEVVARVQQLDQRTLVQQLGRQLDKRHGLVAAHSIEWLEPGRQRMSVYRFRHHFFQYYLYHRLDEAERGYLHETVGNVLEQLYEGQTEKVAGQLAWHFQAAGLVSKAINYLQQAGDTAAGVYANAEAVAHYTGAVELAKQIEVSAEERAHLYLRLGELLLVTKGDGAPEVGQVYGRAFELYQQVGESPQLFAALRGLAMFHKLHGESGTARKMTEQMIALAYRLQDPVLIVEACYALGSLLFYSGEFVPAQGYLEQGIDSYDRQQYHSQVLLYDQDPGVANLSYTSLNLWLLGYPDRALERCSEALALAQALSHPYSVAMALIWVGWVHLFRREARPVHERTEEAISLSTKHDFTLFGFVGTLLRGWALAEQGEVEEGISQMQQSLSTAALSQGVELAPPQLLAPLAETHGKVGQHEAGLDIINKAQALMNKEREWLWMEAELYRLKGELLLLCGESKADVEANLQQAITIARRQEAKSLELRAVMSLGRLWQSQGKQKEAHQMLAEIYGWFTEGFDTIDLKEAKALLEELSLSSNR